MPTISYNAESVKMCKGERACSRINSCVSGPIGVRI